MIYVSPCRFYIETMAKMLKFFQSTLKYYQTMGIYPSQPNQKISFNLISLSILTSMIGTFLSMTTFFLLKAENIVEFSDTFKSFYVLSSEISFVICFLVNVYKMTNILRLIERIENFIQKREFMKLL